MANQPKKYTKFVAAAATATLVASAIVPVASAAGFSDVADTNSHAVNINALAEAGIIGGYPDGTFKPNQELTRGQVVKMLGKWVEAQGFEIPADYATKARFTDLAADAKDQELVKYAALVFDTGVFAGSNGALNAGGKITRENMALVLDRAFKAINDTTLVEVAAEIEDVKVADLATAKAEAREAIQALRNLGISGVENFMPKDSVTRAQFATFLNKTINTDAVVELTVKEAVAVDANTVEVTLSDDTKHTVKLETALEANKETEIKFTIDEKEYTAKVTFVVEAPVVEGVSAINGKELKVKFNKAVSTNSVAVGDFTVTATGAGTANAVVDFKLAEDGKSAILLLTNAVPAAGVDVEIADGAILTSGFDKFPKFTTKAVKVEDTTAPKLVSAVAKDSTTVELTFDEQVDWTTNSGGVSVNGAALVAGVNSTKAGNYTYTFTVPTLKSGTNTVQILNYADFSANKEVLTTTSVNYSADVSTPAVASIKAEDSNSFILTLNKAVDTIEPANFTVKKGNYTFTSADLTVSYVDVDGNPSVPATKYVKVVVPTQANTANPLYATNETSVALSVAVSGYKNGTVIGNEYTGSVTLSKDLTAPKVVSSKLITYDKSTDKIVVPFDKTLTVADASKLTVVSGNVKVAATVAAVGKNLEITITDAAGLTNGTYSLVLDKGLVKDSSNNVNEATTVTTEVTNTASTLLKTGVAIFGTTAVNDNGKNVITVTYGTKVDDAAASTSSYSLNGAALPSGSVAYFTTSAKDEVKIELPASYSVALNDVSAKISLNANAVKEYATGYVVSSSATEVKAIDQVITLKDNVAPTVSKVEYVKDTNGLATGLKLTFSEAVDTSGATDFTNDFVVKTGATEIAYTVAAPSTGDTATDNVVILNFSNASTAASGVTVATNSDRTLVNLTDISGFNKVASFNVSAQ